MKINPIMPIQALKTPPKYIRPTITPRAQISLRHNDYVIIDSVTGARFDVEAHEVKAKFDEINGLLA